jgi:hypothetical protein
MGSLLIYFFGIPPRISPEGHIHLILEQTDAAQIAKGRSYRWKATAGVVLLILSFALQLVALTWPHLF